MLRRVAPGNLYEKAYPGDGRCKCGENDWISEYWERGYKVTCAICGWWECAHTLDGRRHTSDGLWASGNRGGREPKGCPALQGMRISSPIAPRKGVRGSNAPA